MIARTIETATHGRYLVEPPATEPTAFVVGFHGYGEDADRMLARLNASPGCDRWLRVAIQGLNRFYQRRSDEVVAGWMTRQDRELAIADNVLYVARVLDAVARDHRIGMTPIFAGFSQGTAMAFRAAAAADRPVGGVAIAGGDIPPELPDEVLRRCAPILICRGRADEWYTEPKQSADVARLRRAGVEPRVVEFDGGHEWSDAVAEALGAFVAEVVR